MDIKNMERMLAALLNLKDNDIDSLETANDTDGTLIFFITLSREKEYVCPYCGCKHVKSNGFYKKKIILSNDIFRNSKAVLKVPRMICCDCHKTFSDERNMAPKNHQISYSVVLKVMELLKDPKHTFRSVADMVGISPTTVVRIFDKYCHIPATAFPEAICIDEVYCPDSDYDSKYVCIIYDFYKHEIVDVLPSRQMNYLRHYFSQFENGELLSVKYVSQDMYKNYRAIIGHYMKKATICVDSFHVISTLNDCLSDLRIRIMKSYDPDSQEYYLLKRFKFLLFDRTIDLDNKARYNRKFERYMNYRQLLEAILSIDPMLDKAWHLKERYAEFNATCTYENAKEELELLIHDFILSDIPEFEPFVTAISNWRKEIVNSFILYKGRRINSGVAESLNAKVSTLLFNTRGMRNSERRRKRIMYAINKKGFIK